MADRSSPPGGCRPSRVGAAQGVEHDEVIDDAEVADRVHRHVAVPHRAGGLAASRDRQIEQVRRMCRSIGEFLRRRLGDGLDFLHGRAPLRSGMYRSSRRPPPARRAEATQERRAAPAAADGADATPQKADVTQAAHHWRPGSASRGPQSACRPPPATTFRCQPRRARRQHRRPHPHRRQGRSGPLAPGLARTATCQRLLRLGAKSPRDDPRSYPSQCATRGFPGPASTEGPWRRSRRAGRTSSSIPSVPTWRERPPRPPAGLGCPRRRPGRTRGARRARKYQAALARNMRSAARSMLPSC